VVPVIFGRATTPTTRQVVSRCRWCPGAEGARRPLDLLVPPLSGAVHAGDQAGAVDPTEGAVDEPVPRLGSIRGSARGPGSWTAAVVGGYLLGIGAARW